MGVGDEGIGVLGMQVSTELCADREQEHCVRLPWPALCDQRVRVLAFRHVCLAGHPQGVSPYTPFLTVPLCG